MFSHWTARLTCRFTIHCYLNAEKSKPCALPHLEITFFPLDKKDTILPQILTMSVSEKHE